MATRYYTYKRDVPVADGQVLRYTTGKGYWAGAPVKAKPAAPTSLARPSDGLPPLSVVRAARARAAHVALSVRATVAPTRAARVALARKRVVRYWRHEVAFKEAIHYSQTRPIPQVAKGKFHPRPYTTDCSGEVTIACQFAGVSDPNGNSYNGQGYTGTLAAHGHVVAVPKPGDYGVYAKNGVTTHTIQYLGDDRCGSHGSEAGPLELDVTVESAYHAGETLTWYSLDPLVA